MKYIACLILLTFSLEAFEYNLVPQKLTESVYCFFGKPENISKENGGNMVNTCFVQTKEGFVVIDSGPTFGYASQAYQAMQKIAELPVKYVINTHDHDDHWLGNSFYKEKGALLIGPRTYEQNIHPGDHTRMQRILRKEDYEGTKIVKLDKIVDTNMTLKLGGMHFKISQPVSQAHTKGDLIVYIPDNKVLFVGDLAFNDRITSLRDGSVIGSIRAIEKIEKLGADIIVTGHGYLTSDKATASEKSYLLRLKKDVLRAIDNEVEIDKINDVVKLETFKTLKLYDVLNRRNVFDAYRELELYEEEE